jgi:hypothetical protein
MERTGWQCEPGDSLLRARWRHKRYSLQPEKGQAVGISRQNLFSSNVTKPRRWFCNFAIRLATVGAIAIVPAHLLGSQKGGGGRAGGGGGGARMGGSGMGGGGMSRSGGGSFSRGPSGGSGFSRGPSGNFSRGSGSMPRSGGSMNVAPSRSVAPGRPSAPSGSAAASRSVAPNRATMPNASGGANGSNAGGRAISGAGSAGANRPAAGAAAGKATASAGRVPNSSGKTTPVNAARNTARAKTASPAQLQRVNSNLNKAVSKSTASGPRNGSANPQKAQSLASKGNTIRNNWNNNNNNHKHCFNNNWWVGRSYIGFGGYGWWGGWGYSPWLNYYPWWYWWNRPTWNACANWLPYGWNSGYYYDYGPGGNVIYDSGQVMIDGDVVGTDAEYAELAADLSTVDPADLKAIAPADWMPLGTFSMAVREDEVDPARVIQLAVSKNGLISGTIHNRSSGNTYTVQGRVDKETQRLAFTIGEDQHTVLETGIYNLTQDQTPVLCHFGASQTQTYLLARLPEPQHEPEEAAASASAEPASAGTP